MTDTADMAAPADTQVVQDANVDTRASPFAGMDQGLIEGLTKLGIESPDAGLKALLEKQKFIDSSQRYPGADDPEKLVDFFKKIGPESTDAYSDPDLTKFDPDTPFDQESYNAFKDIAHKHNLQPHQFDGVIQDMLPHLAGMDERAKVVISEKAKAAKDAFIEEMGGEQSPQFIEAQSKVDALAQQSPELVELLESVGSISDGRVTDVRAIKVLIGLADKFSVGGAATLDTSLAPASGDTGIDPETGRITDLDKATSFQRSDPQGFARMTGRA